MSFAETSRWADPTPLFEKIDREIETRRWERVETPILENPIEFKRPNNERLIPTGDILADKNFSISLWLHLQIESKANLVDGFRYVKKSETTISNMRLASKNLRKCPKKGFKNSQASANSVSSQFKYLKEQGYILGECDGSEFFKDYKGIYYRMKNTDVFKYYTLMEVDFLEYLLTELSNDALKIYFLYYSFNSKNKENACYLNQDAILERVGLSPCGDNRTKLRFINKQLLDLGLITIDKQYKCKYGVEIKEINTTTAPLYWKTTLYSDMKMRNLEP